MFPEYLLGVSTWKFHGAGKLSMDEGNHFLPLQSYFSSRGALVLALYNSLSSPVSRSRCPDSCASSLLFYHRASSPPCPVIFFSCVLEATVFNMQMSCLIHGCRVGPGHGCFQHVSKVFLMPQSVRCLSSPSQELGLSTPSVSSIFLLIHLVSLIPTRTSPGHLCTLSKI